MAGQRIGLINDVHHGFQQDRETGWIDHVLEELVDRFNDADLDLVIALGDMIEHGSEQEDRERLRTLRDHVEDLDVPLYAIPGNHDVINLEASTYIDLLGAANDRPFFCLDRQDDRIIGLDTSHRDRDLHPVAGRLGRSQRDWLADRLDTCKDVYMVSHHLLHYRDLDGNFYFDDKPELAIAVDKRSVTKLIEEHGSVRAVVSAHIHEEGLERFHGVPHITLGAMDKTDPAQEYEPSTAIVSTGSEGVELSTPTRTYRP